MPNCLYRFILSHHCYQQQITIGLSLITQICFVIFCKNFVPQKETVKLPSDKFPGSKYHTNVFAVGALSGELTAFPDHLAGLGGWEGGWEGRDGRGRWVERREGTGREREKVHNCTTFPPLQALGTAYDSTNQLTSKTSAYSSYDARQ